MAERRGRDWRNPLLGAVPALVSLALGAAQGPVLAQEDAGGSGVALSGYYKNLLVRSETAFPTQQSYVVDLNRLRLKLAGAITDATAFEVQYDHELFVGNYVRTAQFALQRAAADQFYWRLDQSTLDRAQVYGRHRFYRAFVTWSGRDTDVRLGRQRIALGTGRFFSPLDRINPIAPTALEREERAGVDALLVDHRLGPLARLSAVLAPQRGAVGDTLAVHWHGNVKEVDWSLLGGRFSGERMIGLDLATQLGDAGLRAEIARALPRTGDGYQRALLGIDYAFANSATFTAELYYNGAGATQRTSYDVASLLAGRSQNLARRYLGLYASYEITPLLKSVNYLVVNLDDRSRFFSPTLSYSARADLDLTLGLQWVGGSSGSEFKVLRPLAFLQLQYFF